MRVSKILGICVILACLWPAGTSNANEVEKSFETSLKLAAHRASKFDGNDVASHAIPPRPRGR